MTFSLQNERVLIPCFMLEKEIGSCVGLIKLLLLIEAFWGYSVEKDKQIIGSTNKTIFYDFVLDVDCDSCLVDCIVDSLRLG